MRIFCSGTAPVGYWDLLGNSLPAPKTASFAAIKRRQVNAAKARCRDPHHKGKAAYAVRSFQYALLMSGKSSPTSHEISSEEAKARSIWDQAPDGTTRVKSVLIGGTVSRKQGKIEVNGADSFNIPNWDFVEEAPACR